MFCSNCGNQIPDGSKFCSKCGQAMEVSITHNQVVARRKNGNKEIIIIFLIVIILISVIYYILDYVNSGNIVGTWRDDEHNITITFRESGTLVWDRIGEDDSGEGEYRFLDDNTLQITYYVTWLENEINCGYKLQHNALTLQIGGLDEELRFRRVTEGIGI